MSTSELIATIEAKLAVTRQRIAEYVAEARGYEAQLASLRSSVTRGGDIATVPRTEAILITLRGAEGTLSPSEILTQLIASSRDDDLRRVTATLDYLVKTGQVTRPAPLNASNCAEKGVIFSEKARAGLECDDFMLYRTSRPGGSPIASRLPRA